MTNAIFNFDKYNIEVVMLVQDTSQISSAKKGNVKILTISSRRIYQHNTNREILFLSIQRILQENLGPGQFQYGPPNMLKPIWIRINFFPRGKCIPVITGQRLLDRQESEGRIDGFCCQAIYYSSQTKSDLVFIFSTQNIAVICLSLE